MPNAMLKVIFLCLYLVLEANGKNFGLMSSSKHIRSWYLSPMCKDFLKAHILMHPMRLRD